MPDLCIYVFDDAQLADLLTNTIEMFTEFRDHHHNTEEQAQPAAVREMIQHLQSERELASEDPEFMITGQIIPTPLETTTSQIQTLSN